MNLEQYLHVLENCPEEFVKIPDGRKIHRLTAEYGVYDNYPIFLCAHFDQVVGYLQGSNYTLREKEGEGTGKANYIFTYNPGTVCLQVMNYFPLGLATKISERVEEERSHFQKQKDDFNMGITLHPYQDQKIKNTTWARALALVIKDLGEYALQERIPSCFPRSMGWAYLGDYSRIIYFYPQLTQK